MHYQQACSQLLEPSEDSVETADEEEVYNSSLLDHTYNGSQIIGKIIFLISYSKTQNDI